MKLARLSRAWRALVVGTIVLTGTLLAAGAIPWWVAWRSGTADRADAAARTARTVTLALARLPQTVASLDSNLAVLDSIRRAGISAADSGAAADALVGLVVTTLRNPNVRIDSTRAEVRELSGATMLLVVRATIRGATDAIGIGHVLSRLKRLEPGVSAASIAVEASPSELPLSQPELIRFSIVVEALAFTPQGLSP